MKPNTSNTSNDVSPIERLPTEVLALIFSIVVNSNIFLRSGARPLLTALNHASVIASICSRWRSIALGTPSLWSYIDFAGVRSLEHVTLLLDRSGGLPLDLDVIMIPDEPSLTMDSIVSLVLPRLNCVKSIYYYHPSVEIAKQWLSEWLKYGSPATLTTFALHVWSEKSLVFPSKLKHSSQERLDELLSAVSTVYLYNVEVDLERIAFRNLTTLNLMFLSNYPTLDRLVQILLASPALESLQLNSLFTNFGSASNRQLVPLPRLHTLELSFHSETMLSLLAVLMPGSRDLTFKMDLSYVVDPGSSDGFKFELCAFFGRSTVKTLYFSGPGVLKYLVAAPNLEALILKDVMIDEICSTISPPTNSNVESPLEPVKSQWPTLHTIHAIDCFLSDVDGFKRVLSTCPIRELRMDSSCIISTAEG